MLVAAGMNKINFSGGEPFIEPEFLGHMVKYCKKQKVKTVSIVSNGSKIKRGWFKKYGKYLDILAISCDSFDPATLDDIGRGTNERKNVHIDRLEEIGQLCREFSVDFKINSVVCSLNYDQDMSKEIKRLKPMRWKVFQCLLIDGENASENDIRDARDMVVTDEQFQQFCDVHKNVPNFVAESNETMRNSYIILDEYLRFLNNTEGDKRPTESILDIGVEKGLNDAGFDEHQFKKRDGDFYMKETNDSNTDNQSTSQNPVTAHVDLHQLAKDW